MHALGPPAALAHLHIPVVAFLVAQELLPHAIEGSDGIDHTEVLLRASLLLSLIHI